jgi:hypothetical protein
MVAPAIYTENLTIGISLKIVGSDATTTIVDGGQVTTVVTIPNKGSNVSLSKLTIRNGVAQPGQSGGGISNNGTLTIYNSTVSGNTSNGGGHNDASAYGGGIYNGGTVTINNSTISGNSSGPYRSYQSYGGGIYNGGTVTINHSTLSRNSSGGDGYSAAYGGGIFNTGTLTIKNNSTISENRVNGGFYRSWGGGISNFGGTVTINNSTINGNSTGGRCCGSGGGIYNGGTVAINNSTISGNSSTAIGNRRSSYGGGIYNVGTVAINSGTISGNRAEPSGGNISGTATLQNSIVANATSGGNCDSTMTSLGYNLSSDSTCNFTNTGDMNNTRPMLGKLGNYGGHTQTIPLFSGSPAIDAGNPNGCTDNNGNLLKTDQRGYPRPGKYDSGGCDMGAFERQKD